MALAVGDANSATEFVSPTSEEVGHPPTRVAPIGVWVMIDRLERGRWTQPCSERIRYANRTRHVAAICGY